MTQSFYRRPSSRVAGALVFFVAVLLMLAMVSIAANAQTPGYQTLGYASAQPAIVHFGLGDLDSVDLEVVLPHGKETVTQKRVKANQKLMLKL